MLAALLALAPASLLAAPPSWDGEAEETSQNGAMLLAWAPGDEHGEAGDEAAGELEYELQEADDPSFEEPTTRYRGTYPSWFVSGRLDGTHYFRVRSRAWSRAGEWSEWSATKTVVVAHHSLGPALLLLGLGALVFAATVVTLVVGARANTREVAG